MTHGNAVADADCRHHNRCAARHADAGFYRFGDFIEMEMAGHDFAVGGNHADKRPFQFFFGIAHCIKQAAVRRTFDAV